MEFEPLNSAELAAYLRSVPVVRTLLDDASELDIVEVGDGNLNFVYFVSNAKTPEKSVVVKQAPPFLRLVGKTWPLTRHSKILLTGQSTVLTSGPIPQALRINWAVT